VPAPTLILAAPALLGPVRGGVVEPPRASELERLLARSDRVGEARQAAAAPPAAALEAFGCPPSPGGLAALTAGEDLTNEVAPAWLRVDPIHLRPDQDRLLLFHAGTLGLTLDEARALAEAVAEAFRPLGARLLAPCPGRWYLALEADPGLEAAPPWAVAGRDVALGLPSGPETGAWRRALTEAQMLLHAHPANAAREAAGRPAVNGVWLWGGGAPPEPRRLPRAVWSDAPEARALGRRAGAAVEDLPAGFEAWRARAAEGGHVVALGGRGAWDAAYGDETGWRGWVEAVEAEWLAPALEALRTGALARLELVTGDGRRWRLDRAGLRRFWRRIRPLSAWLVAAP